MNDYEPVCEICRSNRDNENEGYAVTDCYMINLHCIELKEARKNRHNKNLKVKETVF